MRTPDRGLYAGAQEHRRWRPRGWASRGHLAVLSHRRNGRGGVPPTGETFLEGTGMMSARRFLPPACGSVLEGDGAGPSSESLFAVIRLLGL